MRNIWDTPIFRPEPMSQREAWLWIIHRCSHGGTVIHGRMHAPGEFTASVRSMASEFGWTAARVQRFLALIEGRGLIARRVDTGLTTISVRNSEAMALIRRGDDTPRRNLRRADVTGGPPVRKTVWDIESLGRWVQDASPRDACIYHIGTLASDRTESPDLNDVAEVVTILQEARCVIPTSHRFRTAAATGWTYIATRTEAPAGPMGIIRGIVTPSEWRALIAIRDRDHDTSITRAIRNAVSSSLGNSDAVAGTILASLKSKGLVAPQEIKGWGLSPRGEEVLG
ncbi:MAG: hypothetical protein LCH92_08205 [Proteobacteria bacterium]|nr:hypothetical protein [Pseudomonadota bacterium]